MILLEATELKPKILIVISSQALFTLRSTLQLTGLQLPKEDHFFFFTRREHHIPRKIQMKNKRTYLEASWNMSDFQQKHYYFVCGSYSNNILRQSFVQLLFHHFQLLHFCQVGKVLVLFCFQGQFISTNCKIFNLTLKDANTLLLFA